MEKFSFPSLLIRFLKKILLIDLGALILVALVSWIAGWRTLTQFSTALFWAGLALIVIGISSVIGSITNVRSFIYEYSSSAGQANAHSRTKKSLRDIDESYGFMIVMSAGGVLAIGISYLILLF